MLIKSHYLKGWFDKKIIDMKKILFAALIGLVFIIFIQNSEVTARGKSLDELKKLKFTMPSGSTQSVEYIEDKYDKFTTNHYKLQYIVRSNNAFPQQAETLLVRPSSEADSCKAISEYYMEPILIPAWWHIGDTINFRWAGGNIPPEMVSLTGVVTDVSGNEVTRIQTNRAGLKSVRWLWKPTAPGFYEVKFSFVDMNGIEKVLSRPVTMRAKNNVSRIFTHDKQGFAVLPPSKPVEKVVGQFGFTYADNPAELQLAKLIGYDLVRLLCDWGASFTNLKGGIESTKGQYNWSIFDKKVDLFANAGFILNAQFNYTPLWASPYPEKTDIKICVVDGTTYAPKDMNDFSRFVEAAVERYKKHISLWEIWNEPSIPGGSIFWSDTPENFVKLLEAGYKAVKKVQPEGQVWLGGLGPRSPYHVFYDKILQLGAGNYFEMLSLHGAWNTPAEKFHGIEENNHIAAKPAVSGEWHAILQGNMQSEPILSEHALSFKMMKDLLYQLKQGISRTMLPPGILGSFHISQSEICFL